MPGIRVDRLLGSTALLLLLSAPPAAFLRTRSRIKPTTPAIPASDTATTPAPAAATRAPSKDTPAPAVATPAAEAPAAAAQPAGREHAGRKLRDRANARRSRQRRLQARRLPSRPSPAPMRAIADQLRNLSSGKFDNVIGNKKDHAEIDAFYSGRNYAPLWITDGKASERTTAAIAYLGHVDTDGLDPADYPTPNFASLSDPADLAAAEIKMTMTVITYAHHASIGRVHWSRVTADASYDQTAPAPSDVLAKMAGATDVAAALDSYEPQTPGYLALKAKLADLRAGKVAKDNPQIASGPVLKVGMQDDRVPQLRERLGVLGDGGTTYDKTVADAVKKYQQDHNIGHDRHAHRRDRPGAQRRQARSGGRHHPRQYGALALDAAPASRHVRHRQPARLHIAGDARQQIGLDDQDRRSASRTCRRRS